MGEADLLRCLVLADTFPSSLDPWRGPYNRRQIECLARLCRVTAIDPMPWPRLLRGPRLWALASRPDTALEGVVIRHPPFWYLPLLGRGRSWRGVLSAAARALKKDPDHRCDVLLATFAYPHGFAAKELAQRLGVPCVIKARGTDLHSLPPRGARRERTAEALRAAAAVVAVSRNLADIALELGAKPDAVHVIPNGVDADAFPLLPQPDARARLGLANDGKLLLFVGSLSPVKGLRTLLDAFRSLSARIGGPSPVQLLLAGDGPMRRRIERRAAAEGLSGSVRLLGHVGREQVALLMNAADLLVLPSLNEGCPNVLLEALSCGTPAVASRVGAAPDLLDGASGILVRPGDAEELARALEAALGRTWDRAALRRRVEGMSWPANARNLERVLRRAVRGAQPAGAP